MVRAAAAVVADQGPALRWERYQVDGVTLGIDVIASLDEPGAGDRLCQAAFAVAGGQGLTVFDPQLGRTVMEGDAETIVRQVERAHAFAEAAPVSAASGLAPSSRLWLLLGLLVVGALVLARALSCLARS
jgi:hypothetical protein